MVMRNWLCVGDPPVTGGAVLSYTTDCPVFEHGILVALVGGAVYCDACKTTGIIAKAGGPERFGFMTKTGIALDGDLCVCNCHPPPPIKATHALTTWFDDMGDGMPIDPPRTFNQHFQVVDKKTGEPLQNHHYVLVHNGEKIEGTTDENGLTKIVYYNSASDVEIHY
jgi:hypothetical protein